jgi:MoaA/NifB/PqqE/SkfB family radical SAM enzyme
MQAQGVIHTLKRYKTLYTHKISVLPIAILMPHSACNCRCVMCDIWKGNKNAKQLTEEDVRAILLSLKNLDTKRIVMSGGEALLNKNFFDFCRIIKKQGIKITLLSTGMTVHRHAENIVTLTDDVIVSLDGDEAGHDAIRNIPGAFAELKRGVQQLKNLNPEFPVSARSVIHQLNYRYWDKIVVAAKEIGLDSISFLPADVSSQAFNRSTPWEKSEQDKVLVKRDELPLLKEIVQRLIFNFGDEFEKRFIVESPEKIHKIYQYYSAQHGLDPFPQKKCNAPWVSTVVEADGSVRPCFFHETLGSVKGNALDTVLNSEKSRSYRKNLNTQTNPTCVKCVCYLNLSPRNRHC